MGIPLDAGIFELEAAAPGKANFEQRERLIAGVAQAIFGVDSDARLRLAEEMNADFLFFNGVAGTQRGAAGHREQNG